MKQKLLDQLEIAITALSDAENLLHPSLGVYADLHQQKLDLQSFRIDVEDGMYEKGATNRPSF